ncbi:hypothetical protein CBL_11942 [Carabus blaptoides fortunei]
MLLALSMCTGLYVYDAGVAEPGRNKSSGGRKGRLVGTMLCTWYHTFSRNVQQPVQVIINTYIALESSVRPPTKNQTMIYNLTCVTTVPNVQVFQCQSVR